MTRSLAAVAAAALAGCGGVPGRPPLHPVRGTLTVDGRPVPGVVLTFLPMGATRGAGGHAFTGPDGRFEVHYARGGVMGAAAGKYRVTGEPTEHTPAGLPRAVLAAVKRPTAVSVPAGGGGVRIELAVRGPGRAAADDAD